jgi:arsenate reductase (glutaredoxin)
MPPQLYVNPACSKCRTPVSILEDRNVQADEVRYLDEPPTVADLRRLIDPRMMMRTSESVYTELALDGQTGDALLDAITRHPILLERPIFIVGDRAVIARPPERLLELL